MLADMQAEADGMTAYFRAHGNTQPPATVNDVIAVTAFIGSIFGAGGGAEASNAEFLSPAAEPPRCRHRAARHGKTPCCSTTPRRRPR